MLIWLSFKKINLYLVYLVKMKQKQFQKLKTKLNELYAKQQQIIDEIKSSFKQLNYCFEVGNKIRYKYKPIWGEEKNYNDGIVIGHNLAGNIKMKWINPNGIAVVHFYKWFELELI